MTYADAQLNCQNKFGNFGILFEPRDANTNKLVFAAAGNLRLGGYWLGINDLANQGQYVYASDGQEVVNGMWYSGQPKGDDRCVLGYYDGRGYLGEWFDYICGKAYHSICQTITGNIILNIIDIDMYTVAKVVYPKYCKG